VIPSGLGGLPGALRFDARAFEVSGHQMSETDLSHHCRPFPRRRLRCLHDQPRLVGAFVHPSLQEERWARAAAKSLLHGEGARAIQNLPSERLALGYPP